jgi:tetratricopeptide (TPR) repeat protein
LEIIRVIHIEHHRMKPVPLRFALLFATFFCLGPSLKAQDASIDQLLKKLPPPEKLVKPTVKEALHRPDPAFQDSIIGEIAYALALRNIPGALDNARRLTAKYPRSPGAHCLRGVLAGELHQFGESEASYKQAFTIDPKYSFAHFGFAADELFQGHYAGATSHFQTVTELEPGSFVGWIFLSVCAERTGHKQESVEHAKRATAVDPAQPATWVQLARAEKAVGHPHETLAAVNKAAEVSPDDAYLLATVGYGYINLNRISEAIPPLQRAAKISPKDFLVHSQLGYCLQVTGQVDAGVDHLRKGASLNPRYGPVWEHLGLAYQKQGKHRDAVKAFERATQMIPTYRPCWQHLAEEYRALGQNLQADRAAARAQSLPMTSITKKKG